MFNTEKKECFVLTNQGAFATRTYNYSMLRHKKNGEGTR